MHALICVDLFLYLLDSYFKLKVTFNFLEICHQLESCEVDKEKSKRKNSIGGTHEIFDPKCTSYEYYMCGLVISNSARTMGQVYIYRLGVGWYLPTL